MFRASVEWIIRKSVRVPLCIPYRVEKFQQSSLSGFNDGYKLYNYAYMASDAERNAAFREGMRAMGVRGSDVLEIGCGPYAPLSELVFEEGARSVTAIEGNLWAAERAAKRLGGRAAVYAGLSQDVSLPDSGGAGASVVVMETVGDIGSLEWMVSTYLDARGRLCRPDAVWLPGKVVTWFGPMARPSDWLNDGLGAGQAGARVFSLYTDPAPAERLLAAPSMLEEYNFNAFDKASMLVQARSHVFEIERPEMFGGCLFWVEVWCGTDDQPPVSALRTASTAWQPMYVALPERRVRAGDKVRCRTTVRAAEQDGPRILFELLDEAGSSVVQSWELTSQTSTWKP